MLAKLQFLAKILHSFNHSRLVFRLFGVTLFYYEKNIFINRL